MREIKFRVWNNKTKEMFTHFEGARLDLALTYYETNAKVSYPMQYTGLKDKNGKEIYEGDILYGEFVGYPCKGLTKGSVVFEQGAFNYVQDKDFYFPVFQLFEPKIIGNIHQNPELL